LGHEEGASGRFDLGARLWTCADGLHRRHNKGRPSVTRDAQGASRPARERDDGGPPNVAQAYRPIGAKNRFQSCFHSGAVGLLTAPSFWRRGIESGFCTRSMELPRLVEVVEARFQLDPAHERGQVLKHDG
jgi:hypothetical protein